MIDDDCNRIASILTREIMLFPRPAKLLRTPSVQPSQVPKSAFFYIRCLISGSREYSIPHAASPITIHPTSASPPANNSASSPIKESPLAEPTIVSALAEAAPVPEDKLAADGGLKVGEAEDAETADAGADDGGAAAE